MTWFVVAVSAPTAVVLVLASLRALLEGWREQREWRFDREREQVRDALKRAA